MDVMNVESTKQISSSPRKRGSSTINFNRSPIKTFGDDDVYHGHLSGGLFLERVIFVLVFAICSLVSQVFAIEETQPTVALLVTHQFGETLSEADISLNQGTGSLNVLEILKQKAMVETGFGGRYVSAISVSDRQFKEGSEQYWFYYVNGSLADVGAAAYLPEKCDHIWWDFHGWDGERLLGAAIGAWPKPLLGCKDSAGEIIIRATPELQTAGDELKRFLVERGAPSVRVLFSVDEDASSAEDQLVIYLGAWPNLEKIQSVRDLFQNAKRVGLFLEYEAGRLMPLDWRGHRTQPFEKAGAIAALRPAFSAARPIWIITGTDTESTRSALNVLLHEPERVKNLPAALVTGDRVLAVPSFS